MCHVLSHLATEQEHVLIMGHFLTAESHQMSMSWRERCLHSLNTALPSHSTSVRKTEAADFPDALVFFYRKISRNSSEDQTLMFANVIISNMQRFS